jgi:hypothetical protein
LYSLLRNLLLPRARSTNYATSHAAISHNPEDPTKYDDVRREKGLRPGGFGLLLVQANVDGLVYNEAQNEVVLVKYVDQ